ncbi:MAG: hypothetical protein ACX930_02480 [Erythrobacter sp.]
MAHEQAKVMVQFHYDGEPPTREAVAARFDIPEEAIDPDFGVIVTDDVERLCTVLVPRNVAAKIDPALGSAKEAEGSFSNPRIAPFGPTDAVNDDGDPESES